MKVEKWAKNGQKGQNSQPLSPGNKAPRILSFGCSTGAEGKTVLTKYFARYPDAELIGFDVDDGVLELARNFTQDIPPGKAQFYNSFNHTPSECGPYDIILANSVLCLHPPGTKNLTHFVESIYPYEKYLETVRILDGVFKVGGIFMIMNSNYDFRQTDSYKSSKGYRYATVSTVCTTIEYRKMPQINIATPLSLSPRTFPCLFRKEHTDRPEPIVLSLDSKKEEIADEEEWYEEALRHRNNTTETIIDIQDSKPIHIN